MARQGKARQGKARQGETRQGKAGKGKQEDKVNGKGSGKGKCIAKQSKEK